MACVNRVEELTILEELNRDRQRLDRAVSELYNVTIDLRGGLNTAGEFVRGSADEMQAVLDGELIALEDRYLQEGQRLPAADIRAARVNQIVREKHPDLWSRHLVLESRETALKQTISGRKAAIGAAQSILKGERG